MTPEQQGLIEDITTRFIAAAPTKDWHELQVDVSMLNSVSGFAATALDDKGKETPFFIDDATDKKILHALGRLREDMNILPPGDVRNCMVALSEDEALLAQLFQHRFVSGDLKGHSFGNLFLAALTEMRGDFAQAVQASSQILAARGCIYPATTATPSPVLH